MKNTALKNPNFRLLWIGQGLSVLGDQFELIAMPWLVLKLTNDPFALGTVLALTGIPRVLFMLLGGAISDRFSPRTVMLISDILRLALTGGLVWLVATGQITLGMIYGFSLIFGLIGGFFGPASNSMVPQILQTQELQTGNSIVSGTNQLGIFIGPMLAGGIIALFANQDGGGHQAVGMVGIALALAFDALTFLVSAVTLWFMKLDRLAGHSGNKTQDSLLTSIQSGISHFLQDPMLRILFFLIAAVNLLFVGPLLVGIPVLANSRLPEGAAAFGLIMSAYGGGNLAGIILCGSLPRLKGSQISGFLVILFGIFGFSIASFAFITHTWIAFFLLLTLGVGNGYIAITLITFLQQNTPKELLGRAMSLILLSNSGLVPLSQALTGWLIKLSINGLFIGAGSLMILLAAWLMMTPDRRHLSVKLDPQTAV